MSKKQRQSEIAVHDLSATKNNKKESYPILETVFKHLMIRPSLTRSRSQALVNGAVKNLGISFTSSMQQRQSLHRTSMNFNANTFTVAAAPFTADAQDRFDE